MRGCAWVVRVGAAALVAIVAAGCGGPSRASGPSGSLPAGTSLYQNALAYSECMRAHGVPNFPDPDSQGRIVIHSQVKNGTVVSGVDQDSPQYAAVSRSCQKLLPNRGQQPSPAQERQMMNALLAFARCMRGHGFATFPDPTRTGNGASFNLDGSGINPQSSQVQSVMQTCLKVAHVDRGAP